MKRLYNKMAFTPILLSHEVSLMAASVVENSPIKSTGQHTETVDFSNDNIKIDGFDTEWGYGVK